MTDDLPLSTVPGEGPSRPALDPADALASLPLDDGDDAEEGFSLELDEIGRPRVPDWVAGSEPEDLALALESVCFVLNRPVTLAELAGILGQPSARVDRAAETSRRPAARAWPDAAAPPRPGAAGDPP